MTTATGDLPDTLTYHDRRWAFIGRTEPADGVLIEGRTEVDEAMLTGESRPVDKRPGDAVVAGSLNLGTPVDMRADNSVSALPMSICPQAMSYLRPSSEVDLVSPRMACLVAV